MKLSHSKLNTILKCPMSYYLNYIQGISVKTTKPALVIGSAVHYGIEHNTCDLSEYFKKNYSFKKEDDYGKEQILPEAMVYGYLKHKDELFEQILTDPKTGEKLELVEEMHELSLYAKLESYKFGSPHDFMGIIDLLLLTNKGFILIDYKTSSKTPDWNNYLDQLYRYILILNSNFPDIPVLKIAIINIRKSSIRQKKNENDSEFLKRLRFEYEVNDEEMVNYHEFLPEDLDKSMLNNYIKNLSKMADMAQFIDNNKLWYINYSEAENIYGKSDYYDIFYHTPGAEILYTIKDKIYDEELECFVDKRDCLALDMKVIDFNNVLNKYETFKKELLSTNTLSKEDFFEELNKKYIVDINLLEIYWNTFIKEKQGV